MSGRWRVELEVVPVGVLEGHDPAPRVLGELVGELDAGLLETLDLALDVPVGLEGDERAPVAAGRLTAVEPDPHAIGVDLAPVAIVFGDREPERLAVEGDGAVHVGHGKPYGSNTFDHGLSPTQHGPPGRTAWP